MITSSDCTTSQVSCNHFFISTKFVIDKEKLYNIPYGGMYMHFFSQLKINGLLLDVQGFFQSKMNILEIHCKEVMSLFKN